MFDDPLDFVKGVGLLDGCPAAFLGEAYYADVQVGLALFHCPLAEYGKVGQLPGDGTLGDGFASFLLGFGICFRPPMWLSGETGAVHAG
jgi:hypothetical protein